MPVLVKEIMSKPVLTIDVNKSVKEAGTIMAKTRKDSLIVTKNRKPIGILTDSDIIKKVVAKNLKPSSLKVSKIMSEPLVSISPDDTILNASRKMRASNIKRIPVMQGTKIVGIISTTDIARTSPELVNILEFKMKTKEIVPVIRERTTSGICESCDNYSTDLQSISGQWICEDCREELKSEE